MQYTRLGESELKVSRICMGCMGFGDAKQGQHTWTLDEEHSREIIKRGLELGVNFFDTAVAYQSGTSEQYLGRALRDFARRMTSLSPPNSCLVRRKKSPPELADSNTLNGWSIPVSETWGWSI